ncbi:MAG: hypothetical protein K6G43_02455 [Lachnospiraceae bacterium]|nr:hypothetical protein [Lachnospiraceae bacterium]
MKDQSMKKAYIIIVNVVIMITIMIFVVLYSGYESKVSYQRQNQIKPVLRLSHQG